MRFFISRDIIHSFEKEASESLARARRRKVRNAFSILCRKRRHTIGIPEKVKKQRQAGIFFNENTQIIASADGVEK